MNVVDRFFEVLSPQRALKRQQARVGLELVKSQGKRWYDAAKNSSSKNGGWVGVNSTDGANEVSRAYKTLASEAQELCRNNPMAKRMKRSFGNNVVGTGIKADVKAPNKAKKKRLHLAFQEWSKSRKCDFETHQNLYGMQHLWATTIFESGGVLLVKRVRNGKLTVQTVEQDYLDDSKNSVALSGDEDFTANGVHFAGTGEVLGYWLRSSLNNRTTTTSRYFNADEVIHLFIKERAGQHLGVTALAPVIIRLDNLDKYNEAKLMQQQIAACFGAIVTGAQTATGVETDDTDLVDTIEPAMIEYVPHGSTISQLSPPKADNSVEFDAGLKRDIAVGAGMSYEQVTGDYSKLNFASGRMAKAEFNLELDVFQTQIMTLALDDIFQWWLDIEFMMEDTSKVTVDWIFPVRAAVNPKEEFDILFSKVRAGMLSPQKAASQLGEKLEVIIESWEEAVKLFASKDLRFDLDPKYFTKAGNQINEAMCEQLSDAEPSKEKSNEQKTTAND
ncbi:hypothetical protein A134_23095 [Vibrio crassostreae 9CS106]|uniref:Phage portal protein n=1 Tax=Vibrio crassostreae 9CS106 TaxID=1191300 RepID=A0A1B1C3C9_9VIBR|nr:hypothetical protein A134_23095 [Vibrio crassostreae 9CS106]